MCLIHVACIQLKLGCSVLQTHFILVMFNIQRKVFPTLCFSEGDWSIHVSTLTDLVNGDVALVAYGDRGNSGPIVLGAPPGKQIFQQGNEDEFRVCIC